MILTGLLTSIAFGQTEVLYVQQNSSLLTYNIDPATLQATLVGNPLPLSGTAAYVQVFPAPNDHFVYVLTGSQLNQMSLSVYATDGSGVPQQPAAQTLGPAAISGFTIDPNGKFAYWTQYKTNSQYEYLYAIRLFTVNSSTGRLTESPAVQVNFAPSFYCAPIFDGFRPNGSEIQYHLFCTPPDNSLSATYFQSSVNQQTGQLGAAQQIFAYSDNGSTSSDEVRLGYRSLNDLNMLDSTISVKVYPPQGGQTPLLDCTSAMLAACGEASQFWQDVSGQYLLLALSNGFDIARIDYAASQITDTGYSIPEQPYFSPDDSILYGAGYGLTTYVQVYGFNRSTGAVTTGAQIEVTPTFWNTFTTVRK